MAAIDDFVGILAEGPRDRTCVFNPWRDWDDRDRSPKREAPRLRRENMAAYLEARTRSARFLLLGEAPSHRGCRFTGIAFCSETELAHKPGLVARRPLALTSLHAETKPQRERSAAVIWGEIERAGAAFEVVLWNAFPWHPYRAPGEAGEATVGPCGPTSNRKPRLTEVADGRAALAALLRCFPRRLEIFAVGKVAEQALERWPEFACAGYMRHPAQGGEARFREAFRHSIARGL
ncbi:MAG TPA: uracil-DNA glycosylase [Usitatibacter sp.]|nr:uracil-DNA glycosylase [Usitatibacter sp.]